MISKKENDSEIKRPSKDMVAKQLMGSNENFASVFNYFLFKGEKRIKPETLHDVHIEQSFYEMDREGKKPETRKRDLLKVISIKEGKDADYVFLGVENQCFSVNLTEHKWDIPFSTECFFAGKDSKYAPCLSIGVLDPYSIDKEKLPVSDTNLRELIQGACP